MIFNLKKGKREAIFKDHKAAVKALAWSPHKSGLLLSGGGNNDKTIRCWNTLSMECVNTIPTDSQVCCLMFSPNSNEFVSSHGFSKNQIIVWDYAAKKKEAILEGH
mmetsp:Transcript_25196/g.22219  ORF Transcript_25196/g.22219 Transcript_25196/m.22219 type:complete len:106 (+) Transcript_25196:1079-1396(+)|eukprot:CAMPEP_0114577984 /NCGR_PEP_ID=MMETSP0125-20121206/2587_1 /TAXON_ID=485358 ORGANISM="Aristerostoma sp., Strain ATCC 50986" /NCGR_SAMPLE_ID=MMETSP0125 /ASSEMBLY_ACC=CAM_ASM_000245 /LENGTH=105 /DNA_ID=CAMNT_0001767727 /DNA_START=1186 /DNA_END=1503 /DNA_ORIENTATION=-